MGAPVWGFQLGNSTRASCCIELPWLAWLRACVQTSGLQQACMRRLAIVQTAACMLTSGLWRACADVFEPVLMSVWAAASLC